MMFARFRRKQRDARFDIVARLAARVLSDNSIVQFRESDVGGSENIRSLINSVSKAYGHNVRASTMSGLVTLYGDDVEFSAKDVVVLKFEVGSGIPG